ncbi:MAG: hypothetical protein WDO74_31200 [Pseudomonadota bacterium]
MMRIAKIADDVGGTEAGAGGAAESGADGDESLRGRGGEAIGRSAFEFAVAAASPAESAGSEGIRALVDAAGSGLPGGMEECERRRIGGG